MNQQNSQGKKSQKSRPSSKRDRNQSGRNSRRRPQGGGQSEAGSGNKQASGNYKRYRGNRNRYRSKNRKEDSVVNRYYNLLEKHLRARQKYFELAFRADPNQKAKLKRQLNTALEELRSFEAKLSAEDRAVFEKRNPKNLMELTYAEKHNLDPSGENVEAGLDFVDPHFLTSQKECDFKEDIEESKGSLEDYLKYKSL